MSGGILAAVLVLLVSSTPTYSYNNGLAERPPMGWNTWCTDDLCGVLDRCTEKEVKSIADALVDSGMKDLGYEYVLLDDCWADHNRDAEGRLQPQPTQFPSGMKALADYIHSKGLKFGLYTCVGTYTCKQKRPGSYNHWDIDAQTFADWEMDFVKADNCFKPDNETEFDLYSNFSVALNATGRHMLFSLCEWGEDDVWKWGAEVGQMYRVQADHLPFWRFPAKSAGVGYGQGTKDIIEWMADLQPSKWTQQYGWMDPDFLMTLFLENYTIGDWTPMDYVDSRTEFSFWALWSSPMILATDPRNMSEAKKSIVMNEEVIAVNQDSLFTSGDRIWNNTDGAQVWDRPLADGSHAVILYNSADKVNATIQVTWDMLGWPDSAVVTMRDLWAHADVDPNLSDGHQAVVGPHDVAMYRVSKQ